MKKLTEAEKRYVQWRDAEGERDNSLLEDVYLVVDDGDLIKLCSGQEVLDVLHENPEALIVLNMAL